MRKLPVSGAERGWPRLAAGLLALLVAGGANAQNLPQAVTPNVLRVCADPANMPFSNRKGEGFENKIAELVASELGVPVRYYWMPQGPGFVRNTLGARLCDLVVGYAAGADPVQHTNPYYQSVYALVVKADGPLADVTKLSDPRLKGRHLGVVSATPPADHMMDNGLLADARFYSLLVDRRYESPAEEMLADLVAGNIDAAVLWGPIAGYFAQHAGAPLKVVPLLSESARPPLVYRVTFGIRPGETEWKHRLNAVIRDRQEDMDRILAGYGVPLVGDEHAPADTGPAGPAQ